MVSNRLALLVVGVACVGAAGVGSYIAGRQNTVAPVEAAAGIAPAGSTAASVTTAPPVAEAQPLPAAPAARATQVAPAASSIKTPETKVAQAPRRPAVEQPFRGQTPQAAPVETASAVPSSAATTASAVPEPPAQPVATVEEAPKAPEPPARRFTDLVIAADSVIGLRTESRLSTERSRVEERIEAKVVRDVRVGGEVAVPAGSRAVGTVVIVERGGKFKERARIGIRFDELQLPNGTRLPLSTDTIFRYGDAPGNSSAAKIGGGAVAGAILGAIIGGGKGAAVGAASGAGAGTGVVAAGDRSEATFAAGSEVTARILAPLTVTVERE